MTDQTDILLVLAQIGVGVAGFGSLATVVGQGYSKTDPEVNSIRLRGLLHIAIVVMLLSLAALVLLRIDLLDRQWAWRIASMLALVTAVVTSIGVLKRDRTRRKLAGYNKVTMVTNFTIMGIVVLALAVASAGLAGPLVGSVFVGALVLMLVGCSTAFFLVVTSFLDAASAKK